MTTKKLDLKKEQCIEIATAISKVEPNENGLLDLVVLSKAVNNKLLMELDADKIFYNSEKINDAIRKIAKKDKKVRIVGALFEENKLFVIED